MKKEKMLKLNKYLISMFILIQPIIDIVKNNIVHDIQIFGLSLFELLNIGIVFVIAIITVIINDKIKFKKYIIFFILIIVYLALHCYNISLFNNNVYEKHTNNYIVEIYYIYRTFINYLVLMLSLYYSKVTKEYVIKLIKIFSCIISSVVISSNLLHIGYLTYGDEVIKFSIFKWFTFDENVSYQYLTCRGLFFSGNQLAAIMFMILPIVLYSTYRSQNKSDYIILVLHIICMYMIGTRVSTLGVLAVLIAFYSIYLFFYILKKTKIYSIKLERILTLSIISLGAILLFLFSPRMHDKDLSLEKSGTSVTGNMENSMEEDKKEIYITRWKELEKLDCYNMDNENKEKFISFFNDYGGYTGISSFILDSYQPKKHIEFWCNYLQTSNSNNYRKLKTAILDNIYLANNNYLDKYLGMGYNLNFIYTEKDYSYQYYNYGILGILLLIFPYWIVIFYSLIKMFKNLKRNFTIENILLIMSPFIGLTVAYFSGHVLERTMPLMILAVICGINLLNDKQMNK